MEQQPQSRASARKPYPSDVSDDEWAFVAPYLTLIREDAAQREHSLREVFNGLRYLVRSGGAWRLLPHDLPPWYTVYQQTQRWLAAGVFEVMAYDLRVVLRLTDVDAQGGAGRAPHPTAVILDGAVLQSTPESGHRAGYSGAKRKKGSKLHLAVDTLGHLLALHVTAADVDERQQVAKLAADVRAVTGESVELAYVDQGYTGAEAAQAAAAEGIALEVVKLPEAKRGFVLLPRRWVVERSIGWMRRFRRLAKDYERLPATVAGLHFLSFVCILLARAVKLFAERA
jgi:transposase